MRATIVPLLVPLLVTALGCATPPAEAPRSPETSSASPLRPAARESLRGERPWAAEDLRIPPGKLRFSGELFAELPFVSRAGAPRRLSPDTIGYLEIPPGRYSGARVLATRDRIQRIEEPEGLTRFCVAANGKTTFAVGERNVVFGAATFDGVMRPLGSIEAESSGAFLVRESGVRSLIDCKRGTIDDFSKVSGYARFLHHSDAMTLVVFYEDTRRTCRMRAGVAGKWEDVPRCSYVSVFEGGIAQVLAETPDGSSTKCVFAIDAEGKRRPCVDTLKSLRAPPAEPPIDFRSARFASPSLLVMVGEKGLYSMPPGGNRSDLRQAASGVCEPVLATAPVFRCASEDRKTVRIVAVDAEGRAKDELTVSLSRENEELRFFETAEGSLAKPGDCNGTPGDAACVRQADGAWKTTTFAAGVIDVLARRSPVAMLLPSVSGDLFLGVGVAESEAPARPVEFMVYEAEKGLAARVEGVPLWALTAMGSASALAGTRAFASGSPTLLWRTKDTFSVWPLPRQHPALLTPQTCRFDVSMDGSTRASCVPGSARSVGRFGMVERKPGELLETFDAGETWFQVPLPEGVDTSDIDCAALGCRIGPYFRLGWGV